jgi:phosphopantetheinyl transferase/malonyl CoA-acyl carrier protein transacylase
MALYSASSPSALLDALKSGEERIDGGSARTAILDPTPERVAQAQTIVERRKPWRGRDGIWFAPLGLLSEGGTLAFMFPGVDISFEPKVEDVARHFDVPVPPCTKPHDLQELGIGIIGVNRMFDRILRDLWILPDDVAGHSIGEWSGMIATGIVPSQAVEPFLATLEPGTLKVPGVVFATIGCGFEQARGALDGLDEIALSHDNCPHQVLVCGVETSVDAALARLREGGVICQKLPFQSGFHSPLFAGYLGPHRENFARLPLVPPHMTLWSATRCAPYPQTPDAIRALALEHLVRPVRFRELLEVLYAKGTRVFVQVGTGSLVNFVEDTLRGRTHMAIAANVKERTGMDQLQRLVASLFVEGANVDVARVASCNPLPLRPETLSGPPDLPADHPILSEFVESMTAIAQAQREVVACFAATRTAALRETTTTRTFSVETLPELLDHSFVRQPPDWPTLSDRQPVVPMTMLVDLMIEHAVPLVPGRVAIAVEDVRAHQWLIVCPPKEVTIACRFDGHDRVRVVIADYGEGVVVFSDRYPVAPFPDDRPLIDPARAQVSPNELYNERWLFHGPAYQGIVDVGVLGKDGIRGTLQAGAAKGALLDNAGQLFGYWVMMQHETDRMAMPVRLSRVHLFGPHPRPGERLECTVRVRSVDEVSVVGDLSLARADRVWALIEGWENRRFETDARLWAVMQWPENKLLSEVCPEGFVIFEDRYRTAPARDRLARRFLGEVERAEYERQTPRRQRAWLGGRIAAKDAVRDLLWTLGHGPLFPVEITIANEASGRPIVRTATGRDVQVSIAHKDDVAVAMARESTATGIDVERIEPRADSFAELSFTRDELRLVEGEARDESWTRLWSAKEAAAKACGTGLSGAPSRFPIRDRAGERLLVGDTWVTTKRHGNYMIAWTST